MSDLPVSKPAPAGPLVEAGRLLELAIEKGVDVTALEKLQAMYERASDRAAAQDFALAMSEFQRKCPPIIKANENPQFQRTTSAGTKAPYRFADLDTIARTIAPALNDCGLSYTWDNATDGENMVTTCTVSHVSGHSRSSSFSCPTESKAGASPAQKWGAANMYARRYSLIAALGLTATETDTDGADGTSDKITSEQADELAQAAAALNEDDFRRFMAWAEISEMAELPRHKFSRAMAGVAAAVKRAAKS